MKKAKAVITNVLVVLVLFLSLTGLIISLTTRAAGFPNLFGLTFMSVQTDSMEPEIMTGDLIIGKIPQAGREYEVGDIVSFRMYVDRVPIINTHRIIEAEEIGGTIYYTTQGDNAPGQDENQIIALDVLSVYSGTRVPVMGRVMDFLQTKLGMFLCVVLPALLFFVLQLFQFVKNMMNYSKENAAEAAKAASVELTEEQKKKAIEEYLAAQAAAKAAGEKPEDPPQDTAEQ